MLAEGAKLKATQQVTELSKEINNLRDQIFEAKKVNRPQSKNNKKEAPHEPEKLKRSHSKELDQLREKMNKELKSIQMLKKKMTIKNVQIYRQLDTKSDFPQSNQFLIIH